MQHKNIAILDKTRPTTRRGFQRSLWDKDGKDMDEMNIMNENDHTYDWEYRYETYHIDKIEQMINFKRLMASQMCLASETSRT